MPDPFRFMSEYFWLILLAISFFNYLKAKRELSARPMPPTGATGEGETYLLRFAIAAALPWAVVAAGQISGATPSIWYYFRPQDGNPFVLAWLGSAFMLSIVYAWWVIFTDGAKRVREFNLMAVVGQRSSRQSERVIKLLAVVGVLFFPLWVFLTVSMNVKVPF